MRSHEVRVHPSSAGLGRTDQLAWKIAEVAADAVEVTPEVTEMIVNRIIDNAAVAAASLIRDPVVSARAQAEAHELRVPEPVEGRRGSTELRVPEPVEGRRGSHELRVPEPVEGRRGSTVFGIPGRYSAEWAAWANGVAVRELDFHDTFLAAEYSHPGDNIAPIVAVAQHIGSSGHDLIRGIATGYEIQVDLVKAISLHRHKIDHVAHLGPSAAAG
ncbi:MAG: hypothetical protein RI885_1588, partial [Actinomycetota bacterium]